MQTGRKVEKEEKLMTGGAWPKGENDLRGVVCSKDVPFSIDAKGGETFC